MASPPHDASFPSDHAAVAGAVSTMLLLDGLWGWGLAGWVIGLIIGAARVAVGVHYPSDILGGLAVGAVSAYACRPLSNVAARVAYRLRLPGRGRARL